MKAGPWTRALRAVGPAVLVAGSAWPAPIATVAGVTLTGDRLLGLGALAVVLGLARGRNLRWTPVHTALGLFVVVQIATSALSARTWPAGLKFVTIYALGFACFALAAECAWGPDGQRRMATAWLAVGVVVAVAGTVLATLANALQTPLPGTGRAQVLVHQAPRLVLFGPTLTLREWNLYSSFLLVPFTLALWRWGGDGLAPSRAAVVGTLVFGLVAGVTRSVWVSMAGLAAAWFRRTRPHWHRGAGLLGMVAAALLLQTAALGTFPVGRRLADWSTLESRAAINRATLASWRLRPVVGHGAGSVNRLGGASRYRGPKKVWNGNMVLFLLHDSGVVGLAALLVLAAAVARRARRAVGRCARASGPSLGVPLLAVGVALAFAYQFTHALWLMYPYVYLGFLTAATDRAAEGG